MEVKNYEALKEFAEKVIKVYHTAALKGTITHDYLRMFGEAIDIRRANKEEERIETEMKKLDEDIEKHLVTAAEKEEEKILRYVLKAIRHLYKGIFNILVFERAEIAEVDHFVEEMLGDKSKLPDDVKKEVAKDVEKLLADWKKEIDTFHKEANATWSDAKGGTSIVMGMSKVMTTSGSSFMRRRKEWKILKDGHKDAAKAAGVDEEIMKMHFKSKEELEKEMEKIEELHKKSFQEYGVCAKLLFIEWEEVDGYLKKSGIVVEHANVAHELPEVDEKQWHDFETFVLGKIVEPFLHNLQEGRLQLARKVEDLTSKS